MPLNEGTNLGPYVIHSLLGAGGMGEVWRAHDTKLDRDVAIKVLPASMIRDQERIARFEREAKLLASINHPNIAAVYGFDDIGDTRFLVMEYVEGETLSQRLADGAVEIPAGLDVAKQMIEALAAAHEKGVVHRDLKPGNVMIRPDGSVKVLDFGLAKAMADDSSSTEQANSPTITANYTKPGVVLGTAAYMSPEQARGHALDKRTDIWSFGVVLYECLTGVTLFRGETATDSMGAIMHREPDWALLPGHTPPAIQRLLRRCLVKDRKKRLRDIADARLDIEEAKGLSGTTGPSGVDPTTRRTKLTPWAVSAVMMIVATISVFQWIRTNRITPATGTPTRYLGLDIPHSVFPLLSKPVAVSPDGMSITWIAESKDGYQIHIDRLDGSPARVIPGTDGASLVFFSPTGERLGFFAGRPSERFSSLYELKTVDIDGGSPVTLCEATLPGSASWSTDGRIYFSDRLSNMVVWVPESGGAVHRTLVEKTRDTLAPYYVDTLPEDRGLLVSSLTRLFAVTDGMGEPTRALTTGRADGAIGSLWDGGRARYVPTGHIAYTQRGRLMAAPFDVESLRLLGPPTPVIDGVRSSIYQETWGFSADGMLVYVPGTAMFEGELVWADDQGIVTPLPFEPAYYGTFRISPDGRRIVLGILDVKWDIWVYDIDRKSRYRLTTEGDNRWPIWSPDGSRIVYVSDRGGECGLFSKQANGAGEPEVLMPMKSFSGYPISFSPDGRYLAFDHGINENSNVLLLSVGDKQDPQPFAPTPSMQWGGMFSPDGKHIAYTSDETGEWHVYVQPFPADGRRWTISTTSFGEEAIWSRDGSTLYFRSYDRWMAVDVETDEDQSLRIENSREVLTGDYVNAWGISYGVAPDGRFLLVRRTHQDPEDRVRVVTNWFAELRKKVPVPK